MRAILIPLYIATHLPVLCVSSVSNAGATSTSLRSLPKNVVGRDLKDSKPSPCADGDSCTCKTFLEALEHDDFTKVNTTIWTKFQATEGYIKVLVDEKEEQKCGSSFHKEKDCSLTFPNFPSDDDYAAACKKIGGYLCAGVRAHERCTKYLHGGEDCSRVTHERWNFPGKSVRGFAFFVVCNGTTFY